MSLQDWEWAVRVGIPPTYLEQTSSPPLAVRFIGCLILWRWDEVMTSERKIEWWFYAMKFGYGTGGDKLFWRELVQKKVGLYGYGNDAAADPIALAKHPWSLKKHEFESAFNSIEDGSVPSVPDYRMHVSAVLTAIAVASGAASKGAALSGIGVAAVPVLQGLATITGIGAGAISTTVAASDWIHARSFTKHMGEFRAIYAKEADYRKREIS